MDDMTVDRYWAHTQRRFGRREVLRAGAAGASGLMGAALIGCSGGKKAAPTPGTGASTASSAGPAVKRGGHVRFPYAETATQWDPYRVPNGNLYYYGMISDRLIGVHPQSLALEGRLIESWETVKSGSEYVLHVRKGMNWENKAPTNGRPFDAEDLVHNIKYAAGITGPQNTPTARSSWYFGISSVTAVDTNTVSLKLSKPNAAILSAMSDMRQSVLPREIPDKMPFTDYTKFPSIGAFVVKEYRDGETAQYTRNPQFWVQGRPYIDSAEIKWFSDPAASNAAILADQLDMKSVPSSQERSQLTGAKGVKILTWDSRSVYLMFINAKKFPDPRLWKAIHLIHNYKRNADALYGEDVWNYTGPLNQALLGSTPSAEIAKRPGWNPATKDADIAEGKKLFAAMGFADGAGFNFVMETVTPQGTPYFNQAIRLQGDLQAALPKIKFEVKGLERTAGTASLAKKEYDGISFLIVDGTDSRIAVLDMKTGGPRNWSNYSNPKVDELIDKTFAQSDKDMIETLAQIEKIFLEEGHPQIRSANSRDQMAIRDRIQGMEERGGRGGASAGNMMATELRHIWLA